MSVGDDVYCDDRQSMRYQMIFHVDQFIILFKWKLFSISLFFSFSLFTHLLLFNVPYLVVLLVYSNLDERFSDGHAYRSYAYFIRFSIHLTDYNRQTKTKSFLSIGRPMMMTRAMGSYCGLTNILHIL